MPTKLSSEGGKKTLVNIHFKQTVTQQMAGNVEWQIGTRAMVNNGMKRGNRRLVLLQCDCTVRLIQETTMKDNPPVVTWSAHGIVITKVMIQISGVVFLLQKKDRQPL